MDEDSLENFNKLKLYTIPMAQFHYRLSYESDKDTSPTVTYICIIIQFLITKGMITHP